ncbi:DUF294 nucleotidyltransferase-like domain-containing protein [Euzebya sp.]|uniref:DUF294 nucleotidyltransferase-like domain-containing protein n=1 Tax=Euzebya sp. TaxID=1971409 RepID=UPI00351412FA
MDAVPQAGAPDEVVEDLVDLLVDCPAFAGVPRRELVTLVRGSALSYAAADQAVDDVTGPVVVQRGGLLVRDDAGLAVDLVAAGEYHRPTEGEALTAVQATLLLRLPADAAVHAWSNPPADLRAATAPGTPRIDLQTTPVAAMMSRDVATVGPDDTCRAAATLMTSRRISSVVVAGGSWVGIVTDRDLRALVASGRSPDDPVSSIATSPVRTTTPRTPLFDALVEMLTAGIHHLPVADGDGLVGMVTSSDVLQTRLHSPLHLRKQLDRATTVEGCAAAMGAVHDAVRALRAAGTTPAQVAEVLSGLADRCTAKLIDLASAELGPPPAPYGWIAFGSLGRRELGLTGDQDTGMIVPDGLGDDDRAWFRALAERVTDGLERAGFPRCRGGVMATESAWHADVSSWRRRLSALMARPTEHHLMEAEIAFDLRTVDGDLDVLELLGPTIRGAASQGVFLGRLARQAIGHRPPLGFMGRLTVDRHGTQAGTFDLKAGALMPIVDLARLHALTRGGLEIATAERLAAAVEAGQVSADLGDVLAAGYELALGIRLDMALERHAAGLDPSNRVDPSALPPLVRSQLKETFRGVRTAQEVVQARHRLVAG